MAEYVNYSSQKWFESVNDIIESRRKQCKPGTTYLPPSGAYFKKIKPSEFENKYPFVSENDCIPVNTVSNNKDANKRYYVDVFDKTTCDAKLGIWKSKALNRHNRYGQGVCWVGKQDAKCGTEYQAKEALMKSKDDIDIDVDVDVLVQDASQKCNADADCAWHPVHRDCLRKSLLHVVGDDVDMPPDEMPHDITSADIEQFLYDWYVDGAYGYPPITGELMGKGDRCNVKKGGSGDREYPDIDLTTLYVKDKDDEATLRRILKILKKTPEEIDHVVKMEKRIAYSIFNTGLQRDPETDLLYQANEEYQELRKRMTSVSEEDKLLVQTELKNNLLSKVDMKEVYYPDIDLTKLNPKMVADEDKMTLILKILGRSQSEITKTLGAAYNNPRADLVIQADRDYKAFRTANKQVKKEHVRLLLGKYEKIEPVVAPATLSKTPKTLQKITETPQQSNKKPVKQFISLINNKYPDVDVQKLDLSDPDDVAILRRILFVLGRNDKDVKQFFYDKDKQNLERLDREYRLFIEEITPLERPKDTSNKLRPSLPQSVVNMIMKNIALKGSSNRGIMALHSTGSGKTCTAAGVMDSFWDTNKQIVFVSSIEAVTINPPFKFHECASQLFPRFKKNGVDVAKLFDERGVIFLPFAKLANRIEKTEKFKTLVLQKSKTKKGGVYDDIDVNVFASKDDTKPGNKKTRGKKRTEKKENVQPAAVVTTTQREVTQQVDEDDSVPRLSKESSMGRLVEYLHSLHNVPRTVIYKGLKDLNINSREDYVDLDNTCLIIDEVHNLFRPLPNQREKHRYVESHIIDPNRHPEMKVAILTATPGDNVQDIIKLLNIVRDPTHPPIKAPNVDSKDELISFKKSIRGLVSFFDMSSDTTLFPIVNDPGPIKYPMSTKQFERYIDSYKDVQSHFKDYDKLAKNFQLNKFWQGARKYSNMLFNFEQGMKLTEFSSKLPALLNSINSAQLEKHYVYSSFYEARGSSQGILEIARQLENMGYKKLSVKEAKEWNKKGVLPPKGKRYVLALQKDIGDEGSSSAGDNLAQLVKIYNATDNKNGEIVHVFLATQGFNEGIDLKAVRHVHFFEPLVTLASDLQTIGRARRRCSHADLNKGAGEWNVQIHRYESDFPVDLSLNNIDSIKKKIQDIESTLQFNTEKYEKMKKMKPDEIISEYGYIGHKESVKNIIRERSKELKALQKDLAMATKNDFKQMQMIDEFIRQNAIEKMKELFILHLSIKEAAVDCKVLQEFHNSSGPSKIVCESFS